VLRNGIPIWEHGVKHSVRTGIEYEPLIDGCVPEFEEREAAVYCHYSPLEFRELAVEERARTVAQYRLSRLVALHAEDAVNRKTEEVSRKRGR